MNIAGIHHVAIIVSDYERSRRFYTQVLGLEIVQEKHRPARQSWKLDLQSPDGVLIEMFSFPNPPKRVTQPEACGLRHIAFRVSNLDEAIVSLRAHGVEAEAPRIDEHTGRRFTFFMDPDGLPLELYEV